LNICTTGHRPYFNRYEQRNKCRILWIGKQGFSTGEIK
jgi:hypothetical protein